MRLDLLHVRHPVVEQDDDGFAVNFCLPLVQNFPACKGIWTEPIPYLQGCCLLFLLLLLFFNFLTHTHSKPLSHTHIHEQQGLAMASQPPSQADMEATMASLRAFNVEAFTLLALALAITCLRTFARIRSIGWKNLWADDYLVVLAVVSSACAKGNPDRLLIVVLDILFGRNRSCI